MIRRILVVTVLFLGIGATAFAQRPDFRGQWRLDRGASSITTAEGLAGLRSESPDTLFVQQSGDETVILSSRLPGSKQRNYLFDGSTWLQAMRSSDDKIAVSSRVLGLGLVSEGVGRIDGQTVSIREVLLMDPSGQKLTLQVTTTIDGVAETNTLIYRRAS